MKSIQTDFGPAYLNTLHYAHGGGLAIELRSVKSLAVIAMLTVNLPEANLENDEFCVKGWSENSKIIENCRDSELFIDTGKRIKTGFCEAEVWKFNI